MLDQEDPRPTISPERWAVIDDWFDGVKKDQADLAAEMAGWVPRDGGIERVLIDRACHVAVYVRQDGTRFVKRVPEFNDDPFAPPAEDRRLDADPLRVEIEALVSGVRASLVGRRGIEDIWLAPDMDGVVFDRADGTTALVPIIRFLELFRPYMI